jgi:hypothetical protein
MYVILAGPTSFILAQIVLSIVFTLSVLITKLALAISLFKILLVTNFSIIFPCEPNKLGTFVVVVAGILAFFPSLGIFAYQTSRGEMVSNSMIYLTKSNNYHQGIPYMMFYIMFWTMLSIIAMLSALFYIPHHLKKQLNYNAIQLAEADGIKKQVNIKKMLFGMLGTTVSMAVAVLVNKYNSGMGFPVQMYPAVVSLNLVFTYFILEEPVLRFLKRKVQIRFSGLKTMLRGSTVSP